MKSRILLFLFLAGSGSVFAQLAPNTLTVTASHSNGTAQPDQAIYNITIAAPVTATLDQVSAAVTAAGISGAIFTSAYGPTIPATPPANFTATVQWTFSLAVPIANMKATVAMLSSAQSSLAQNNPGMSMTFTLQGLQVSQQAQQQSQSCAVSALLSDAQSMAQTLASAAGAALGPVLSISSSVSNGSGSCGMTVQFALGH